MLRVDGTVDRPARPLDRARGHDGVLGIADAAVNVLPSPMGESILLAADEIPSFPDAKALGDPR